VGQLADRGEGQERGKEDRGDRRRKRHPADSIHLFKLSPQRSNRSNLVEGTLRCLEHLPPERITARAIAAESGANLASIAYHFGSKENLLTEAVIEGLDRWLAEVDRGLDDLPSRDPEARFRRAIEMIETTRRRHTGLARNFVGALAKAQHDPRVRELLAEGFRRTRPNVASLLGLGTDPAGRDAAGLVLALFDGLLFQTLLDPALAVEGARMRRAQRRLLRVLPDRGE
jgi:AcrR family transcriptional regulator